jgi:Domain of unknown function (DUF4928)
MKLHTPLEQKALEAFEAWFNRLQHYPKKGDGPARGTIAAALVVLEHLKTNFSLKLEDHRAKGKSQIKGVSPGAVKKILNKHGESRDFLKEGGRTNRGAPGDVEKMLQALRLLKNERPESRNEIINYLQDFLVEKVREYHLRQRLKIRYSPQTTTWQAVHDLLNLADDSGKAGAVAQYLVGAKLQLKFPEFNVRNESFSTADDPRKLAGDFQVGDTVFHVTVSPMPGVYAKSKANIDQGLKVYLLVPYDSLVGAKQTAEGYVSGQIAVESIESFVSQNLEELALFSKERARQMRLLLETYNERVSQVETDKSLLIEIPENLLGY